MKNIKKIISILLVGVMVFSLCACEKKAQEPVETKTTKISKADEMRAKLKIEEELDKNAIKCGLLTILNFSEDDANNMVADMGLRLKVKYYDNISSMLLALQSNKIDLITYLPESTARYIATRNKDVVAEHNSNKDEKMQYYMAVSQYDENIYDILDKTLNEMMNDGTFKALEQKYIDEYVGNVDEPEPVKMPYFEDAEINIRVVVTGDLPPFDYAAVDGTPAGYNVAVLSEIANRAHINIELVTMDSAARAAALAMRSVDVVFWVGASSTESERHESHIDCPIGAFLIGPYYEAESYNLYIKDSGIEEY